MQAVAAAAAVCLARSVASFSRPSPPRREKATDQPLRLFPKGTGSPQDASTMMTAIFLFIGSWAGLVAMSAMALNRPAARMAGSRSPAGANQKAVS